MRGSGLRRLRLVLGVAVAACALLSLLSGTASATLRLDTSSDTARDIDSDIHWFSGMQVPLTSNGYQYWAYWDSPDPVNRRNYLMLTRRRLSDNNLVTLRFDGSSAPEDEHYLEVPMDGHNSVGLGLSTIDGRVHLSWSLHEADRRHRYLMSAARCLEQTQENFTFANCRFTYRLYQADRVDEEEMSYPNYFTDQDGHLYFSYRFDASTRGDSIMNRYEDDGTWTQVGTIIRGVRSSVRGEETKYDYTFDPDGAGPARSITSVNRGTYVDDYRFDKDGLLHVSWVWRENNGGYNHGVYYAYSDDHGVTWYNSAGRRVGTADRDPITILDQTDVSPFLDPPGYYLNQSFMTLDSNNQPHIVKVVSDVQTTDPYATNQRRIHYWRTADGTWYSKWIETPEEGTISAVGGEMFLDKADNLYATFTRNSFPFSPQNTSPYVQAQLPFEKVTMQPEGGGNGFMDVQLFSIETCLESQDDANATISLTGANEIRMRMRNDTDVDGLDFYWTTDESPTWVAGRLQTFARSINRRDRNYTEYTFRVTSREWTGSLRTLVVCLSTSTVRTGSFSTDWIKIYNPTTRTAVKTWELNNSAKLYAAEANQADNWETWNIEELQLGINDSSQDGWWRLDRQRYADSGYVDFGTVEQGRPGIERLTLHEFRITGDTTIKDWRFDADTMGWTAPNHVSGFRWANERGDKGLSGELTGNDSRLLSRNNLRLSIGSNRMLHVRMRNSSDSRLAHVYFITSADRTWNETKSRSFAITARSGYLTYNLDMSGVSGWREGSLYQLRLDPSDDATTRGQFDIDRVYINNSTP